MTNDGIGGTPRDRTLAALLDRLEHIGDGTGLAAALAPDLLDLAAELSRSVPNVVGDMEVLHAVGWLHWLRYLAAPVGEGRDDSRPAIQFLEPVYAQDPTSVPAPVQRSLDYEEVLLSHETAMELHGHFNETGDASALRNAIALFRETVTTLPSDNLQRPVILSNFGAALQSQFEHDGNTAALEEAIALYQDAVEATDSSDGPLRAILLSNIGVALQSLFDRTGDPAVLQEAISVGREVIHATPAGDSARPQWLSNLGGALATLFEWGGDPAMLAEAVTTLREAVATASADDPARVMYLTNLCEALRTLFDLEGDRAVLNEAIAVGRTAVGATPVGASGRPARLSVLGTALLALFRRSGEVSTLDEAITFFREAVATIPTGHPDRAMYLSNLSVGLQSLFERRGDAALADEAIEVCRDAVSVTPAGHPRRAMYLSNFGAAMATLFQHNGDLTVLEQAITAFRASVEAVPAEHPARAGLLINFGKALYHHVERGGDPDALTEGRACFAAAEQSPSAPIEARVTAMLGAARLGMLAGDHAHAVATIERVCDLLPQVAPRRLRRADRAHRLSDLEDLAPIAAAAAIGAGNLNHAVELLEQTRGVLLADTIDFRGDITDLRDHAPTLAAEFDHLRQMIEELDHDAMLISSGDGFSADPRTGSDPGDQQSLHALADQRALVHTQWTQLLERIRKQPRFSGFLRPAPIDQLRRQASNGPIIYVSTLDSTGHALIIVDDPSRPVRVVPLPGLNKDAAYEYANQLKMAQSTAAQPGRRATERQEAQQRILDVLRWLWDTIAEPVLRELGHTTNPAGDRPWPRVWWCPVGILAFLPLHAAGHHLADTNGASVIDRVVSSYTATIRVLTHARDLRAPTTAQAAPEPSSMVIVTVPDPPNGSPLPGAQREARNLRHLIPRAVLIPQPGSSASRDDVTAALPKHRIAHFACHGISDWAHPGNSRLLLHDHLDRPLTIATIARLNLPHAELAYLSACSTTDTQTHHADEAAHITSAFQLAGYRNVIGTLWPINDLAAAVIANDFYGHLTQQGTTPPAPDTAAIALHHTIRQHRDQYRKTPTRWAAHIHTGI